METIWTTPLYNAEPGLSPPDLPLGSLPVMDPAWQQGFREEELQQDSQITRSHASHHHQLPRQATLYSDHDRYDDPRVHVDLGQTSTHSWAAAPQHHLKMSHPPTPVSPFDSLNTPNETASNSHCPAPSSAGCWNRDLCLTHRQHPSPPELARLSTSSSRRCSVPTPSNASPPSQGSFAYPNNADDTVDPGTTSSMPRASRSLPINFPSHYSHHSSPEPRRASTHHPVVSRIHHHTGLGRRSSMQSLSGALSPSRLRVPHNLVERRYRDNLNNQIEALRLTLPNLRDARPSLPSSVNSLGSNSDHQDDVMSMVPRMPSKAMIISTAATYIKDLEAERDRLLSTTKSLQEQVYGLQKYLGLDRNDGSVLGYFNKIHGGHGVGLSGSRSS